MAPSGTVTLLFSDIEGSTLLLRRTGDAYPELLERHRTLLREAFESHGGQVLGTEGDGFFVAFASAVSAAAAAVDGQRDEFPPLNTLDHRFLSLPAVPNAFVGRERELAETGELLARDDMRLLT